MNPTRCQSHFGRSMLRREIRNPNVEIRNKFETRMTEETLRRTLLAGGIGFQPFDIRACFGFRISDFEFFGGSCATGAADLESCEGEHQWS